MNDPITDWRNRRASMQAANKKLVQKLRKKKKKPLNELGDQLHEEVFKEVDCLSCANCCKTTGPLLRVADIKKISRRLKIGEGRFIDEYLRIDEEGDYVFKSMPCPFLESDNKCGIYEDRPKACRQFPHTDQKGQVSIFHLTRKNARVCPAVAKIARTLVAMC